MGGSAEREIIRKGGRQTLRQHRSLCLTSFNTDNVHIIDPEDRLFASSGAIYPGGPSTWYVVDWDQRRLVSVTMDEELESEDPALEHLLKHIDDLAPDVYEIYVSSEGFLISTSTDAKDDETYCPFYPPLSTVQNAEDVQVISRAGLEELDRLSANVDLVIVVDELKGRFVGFTTVYIAGGTLEENKTRQFKLKWLQQLIDVVDELNLNLGIAHQDVAPRNIVINEETDSLMLFDFNFSVRIGRAGYSEPRNDIKGVMFSMYEIITRNDDLRDIRHEDQDVSVIENQDWVKHPDVLLDHPVSEFRALLTRWCEKRRSGKHITVRTEAPNFLDWPPLPDPPLSEVETHYQDGTAVKKLKKVYQWRRTELRELGRTILNWQRPPQRRLAQNA
ncbi:uncharacterized protein TRUGW13939_07276 [Talaromyces rugulosus]|uniref:Protein kinase domain-containing protein n=1 Tax=Talaromyces rugulosus TaxID=121627 RepID=A0A7H8R5K5_TALRU|nr:uncharacterized protein TRUGW13939_07276 [Talaromyces rugulosus]QKX60133.1 hypothetical protein TRUGW13939_07276 [Talaromyces rugulosus]